MTVTCTSIHRYKEQDLYLRLQQTKDIELFILAMVHGDLIAAQRTPETEPHQRLSILQGVMLFLPEDLSRPKFQCKATLPRQNGTPCFPPTTHRSLDNSTPTISGDLSSSIRLIGTVSFRTCQHPTGQAYVGGNLGHRGRGMQ